MSLKHMAARVAVTSAVSLAALLFSAVASAEPPAPQDPGAVDNVAADENPREEQPAENDADCPWCDVVKAAQQLPPPDFSGVGVPPLADVSVPLSFGLGLPDVVPDVGIPITLPAPQLPAPQLPPPPPPPQLPQWQPTWCGPSMGPFFTPCV